MATYAETKIFEGLCTRLNTITFSPVLPIQMPNTNLPRPSTGGYLKVNHLPAETQQITNETNRHRGLFQVSVYWPEDEGESKASERAGLIIETFKVKTTITHDSAIIRILRPPYKVPMLPEPAWIQIPVRIPYVADFTI